MIPLFIIDQSFLTDVFSYLVQESIAMSTTPSGSTTERLSELASDQKESEQTHAMNGTATNGAPSQRPIRIAIIGGGIGGLALTIGLLKHSHLSPHIYEAAPVFSEIGAGVASGANAVRALGLIDEQLIAAYKRWATYDAAPGSEGRWMNVRHGMAGRGSAEGAKPGELMYELPYTNLEDLKLGARARSAVHRANFLDEMVKLIPQEAVSFNKGLVDFKIMPDEERGGEAVKLTFTDSSTALADVVIGCDGIKSAVRKVMCQETGRPIEPIYTGDFAYRCLAPTEEAKKVYGEDLATSGNIYSAYEGYSTQYPVSRGDFLNVIVIHRDPSWDPNSEKPPEWRNEQWTIPAGKEKMLQDLKGWFPATLELLSKFSTYDRWALFHLPHNESYIHSSGLVALMGDSAHATTPHLGAGAGMAIEDAYMLSNLLGKLKPGAVRDIPEALQAYDEVRRPRTQKLVAYSHKAKGMLSEVPYSEEIRQEMTDMYHWVWMEDLEEELDTATTIFKARCRLRSLR